MSINKSLPGYVFSGIYLVGLLIASFIGFQCINAYWVCLEGVGLIFLSMPWSLAFAGQGMNPFNFILMILGGLINTVIIYFILAILQALLQRKNQ
jgi:hypothetical protein